MKIGILLVVIGLFVIIVAESAAKKPKHGRGVEVRSRAKRQTGAVFLPAFYFKEKARKLEEQRQRNKLYRQKYGYQRPSYSADHFQPWFGGGGSWFNSLF